MTTVLFRSPCTYSKGNPMAVRELNSESISRLVKITGIIIAASSIKAKMTQISLQCHSCRTSLSSPVLKDMPCLVNAICSSSCWRNAVVSTFNLQEWLPDFIPYLGNLMELGINPIKKSSGNPMDGGERLAAVGVRSAYLRLIGIITEGSESTSTVEHSMV